MTATSSVRPAAAENGPTPPFTGVNHFALSVTDLDRSTWFYTEILGLLTVLDLGYGRVCMHTRSGFTVALIRHPGTDAQPFSELHPGLDHIGLAAGSRDELIVWRDRFEAHGVPYTPIQDMPLGHHLNFRDPDGIPLEFQAPNEAYSAFLGELRTRDVTDAEVLDRARQVLGAEIVAGH